MYQWIKEWAKRSFFIYEAYLFLRQCLFWLDWIRRGRPVPPPHIVKQWCVLEYGRKFNLPVLVETGTFQGEMVRAVRSAFREIYTIELGQTLCAEAQRVFGPFPHIHVLQGDSAKVLRDVLSRIEEPCLFWLDAHYSGEGTTIGDRETPVLDELDIIFSHTISNHVILIDDARRFDDQSAYPALAKLEASVNERRPGWICKVQDDIIRIHPLLESRD
jgi:hypothetical protein